MFLESQRDSSPFSVYFRKARPTKISGANLCVRNLEINVWVRASAEKLAERAPSPGRVLPEVQRTSEIHRQGRHSVISSAAEAQRATRISVGLATLNEGDLSETTARSTRGITFSRPVRIGTPL